MDNEKYITKHWYAMRLHLSNAEGWNLQLKVFSGTTRTQAMAQAKKWAQSLGFQTMDVKKVHSFDSEEGANWQIEEWKKALR